MQDILSTPIPLYLSSLAMAVAQAFDSLHRLN